MILASPDGHVQAALVQRGDALKLAITKDGRRAVTVALGGVAHGTARVTRARQRERFTTPAGKRRVHRLDALTMTVRYAGGHRVQVLAADDGVAFRETRPGATTIRAPHHTQSWLQTYRSDYEAPYLPGPLSTRRTGRYAFPELLRTNGRYTLLTESGVTTSAVSHTEIDHGAIRLALPPDEPAPKQTPWRVAIVGSLADVVQSDLPLTLGRPSRIRDTRWIHPGIAAWSWWSDRTSGQREAAQKVFVDAAAANGWRYATVDAGWDPKWIPDLVRYATARGVHLILWFDVKDLVHGRAATFAKLEHEGIAGVKVDFLLSDRAARIRLMNGVARDAAAHHLVVDFHGCTVPRGIQRTWPNVLSLEAVFGAEHATTAPMSPAQSVDLVFTRNVIGSMDYTPVTFSAPDRETSDAHELAEAVAFESGLQHFADMPIEYTNRPLAQEVLSAVPAAWDDTRLVAGAPDRYAVVARRSGGTWWVGGLSAGGPRIVTVPLRFLGAGNYTARMIGDGADGLQATDETVTRDTNLRVAVVADGGFTLQIRAAR